MAILYVWSGAAGSGSGADWTNAKTTLTAAFATEVAGDTLYVAHDHAESTAGAVTLTSSGIIANPTKVVCVNRAGSVPPVAADLRATATVTVTSNNNLTFAGSTHYDGIVFSAGTGSSSSSALIIGTVSSSWFRFDNCSLRLPITGTGTSAIWVGGASNTLGGTCIELNNTTISFAGTNQMINVCNKFVWRNTATALIGAVAPDDLFTLPSSVRGASVECIGVDLSALGSGKNIFNIANPAQAARFRLLDCKLNASVTKSSVPVGYGSAEVDIIRSGATGVNHAIYCQRSAGLLIEETTIVRTGGASDGTTPIAWKIATTASCTYSMPFECPPIAIWCDATGSVVTATVEGIWGGGAVPTDDEIWLDVEYLSDASSPQGAFVNDGKANLLAAAAAQSAGSGTWGGSTTKFALACTFTPQQKGWIYARVKCAKVSSTFYIDPLVTLT